MNFLYSISKLEAILQLIQSGHYGQVIKLSLEGVQASDYLELLYLPSHLCSSLQNRRLSASLRCCDPFFCLCFDATDSRHFSKRMFHYLTCLIILFKPQFDQCLLLLDSLYEDQRLNFVLSLPQQPNLMFKRGSSNVYLGITLHLHKEYCTPIPKLRLMRAKIDHLPLQLQLSSKFQTVLLQKNYFPEQFSQRISQY